MSKYLLTFEKTGYIKYTSHLDMLRFFQRLFRRAGVKLAYSQGFNPHPKMSFALPLSLGYTGLGELLEIETAAEYGNDELKDKVNAIMPEGLKIVNVEEFVSKKAAGSTVYAADFIVEIPLTDGDTNDYAKLGTDFMSQESIMTQKLQRKSGKMLDVDIRPLITSLEISVVDNNIIMETCIAQGSQQTLSPDLLVKTFLAYASVEIDFNEIEFTRKKIYFS